MNNKQASGWNDYGWWRRLLQDTDSDQRGVSLEIHQKQELGVLDIRNFLSLKTIQKNPVISNCLLLL